MKLSELLADLEVDEAKASKELCTSARPNKDLGASNLASCKSQGYRQRNSQVMAKETSERKL